MHCYLYKGVYQKSLLHLLQDSSHSLTLLQVALNGLCHHHVNPWGG